MKRLHQGFDYTLYKVYVWGGLAALVIYTVVVAIKLDQRNMLETVGMVYIILPLMGWVGGILLYWWWVFLFKGNKELEELANLPREGLPGIKSLKSWNILHQAMAVQGGDIEEYIQNAKKANPPIIVWYGTMNLLVLWVFGPFILEFLGLMPDITPKTMLGIWVGGVIVWVPLMLVVTYIVLGWGGKASEKAYIAPLGLEISEAPGMDLDVIAVLTGDQKLFPDGPSIVEGKRHGRLVYIEMIGKHCLTIVRGRLPEFKVKSDAGKLIPNRGAPKTVIRALKSLRKAKRWRGIEVNAGSVGIGIQRKSKGTNMWLYDLWLAEYLLDKDSVD